jgi:hypothetical protein
MTAEQKFSPVSVNKIIKDESITWKWERSPFQDKRRLRTWQSLCERMVEKQSPVTHKIANDWAEMTSYYRFFNNERIKVEEIIYHSCHLKGVSGQDLLIFGDTSSYNLKKHVRRIRDAHRLGVLEDNTTAGYFTQCFLAVNAATESVLGLADLMFWNRPKRQKQLSPAGKKLYKPTYKMAWEDKESSKWSLGIDNACRSVPTARSRTFVFDRGADVYELYKDARWGLENKLVCRACYDRQVIWEGKSLRMSECLEACPSLGSYEVKLPALNHFSFTTNKRVLRQARKAHIEIRCCAVGLLPPTKKSAPADQLLSFYLIEAKEIATQLPPNEEAIHWWILTNIPTQSFEQARYIVHVYTLRWMIEQLFRLSKKEGFRLESTEMESVDAIFKQAAIALHSSCKVLQLVYARNAYEGHPIGQVFDETEIQILEHFNEECQGKTLAQKNPFSKNQLSWAAWVIARMGGWKGYRSKRPPGPITMLQGLEKLHQFILAWQLFQKKFPNGGHLSKAPPA